MHAVELIAQRQSTTNVGNLAVFIYAGLCGNSYAKSTGTEPTCKEDFEDITEWASDILKNQQEVFVQIMDAYFKSKPMQDLAESDKKKVIVKKVVKKAVKKKS